VRAAQNGVAPSRRPVHVASAVHLEDARSAHKSLRSLPLLEHRTDADLALRRSVSRIGQAAAARREHSVLPSELAIRVRRCPRELGPKGLSAPSIERDLRVGGGIRIAMQPPDGDRFFLLGEFREVNPVTRLIYTFRWEPPDPTIGRPLLRSRFGIWASRLR
jgi:Activator of Hsp90 ATPase homolog 1-like protein